MNKCCLRRKTVSDRECTLACLAERLKQLELEAARQAEEAQRRAELKKAAEEKESNRLDAARCWA